MPGVDVPAEAAVTVRRAVAHDAVAVADVWLRSRHAALPLVPPPAHSDDEVREWFATVVVPTRETWVAELAEPDGEVVAVLVLDGDELDQLYVDPAWAGRGIGSRLVRLAQDRRPSGLALWTFAANGPARAFYERHGFVAVRTTDGAGNEERAADVRYVWGSHPEGKPDARTYWDGQAASFDTEPDHGLTDPVTRKAWRALLDDVLPAPPCRVADLGCGTGSLAVLLAEQGHAVTGVDVAPAMLAEATAKARRHGVHISFETGDAADPALEPRAFDVVLARHVLWAMPDPADCLRRWLDLLADGGRLVLVEGMWSTGAGLESAALLRMLEPLTRTAEMRPLTDPALWGREIEDDRYLVVAR